MKASFVEDSLAEIKTQGLYRQFARVDSPVGRRIIINNKEVLNFSSNDYLGLAYDKRLIDASIAATRTYGVGAGASRLICGNQSPYGELEAKIAKLKGSAAALVFSSGWAANAGIIPTLVGRNDVVFCDRLNHASIIDGIILSRARLKRYAHLDMKALQESLKAAPAKARKLIVTDSVFSMDGDVAPLDKIIALAREYDAMVMVDEAHGFGVLGPKGGGLVEQMGLGGQIEIQMGTLSKAAGCLGAYVSSTTVMREYLINHARSLIYSTALPASIVSAAACALELIADEAVGGARRRHLERISEHLRGAIVAMGYSALDSKTPIIPLIAGTSDAAIKMSEQLFKAGFYVQAIRPPTVPGNTARLRITLSAAHTDEDIEHLILALRKL